MDDIHNLSQRAMVKMIVNDHEIVTLVPGISNDENRGKH
jgi:hypothetical protein